LITAEQWYDPNPDLKNYYQGDVLSGFPFPSLPTLIAAAKESSWGILRPRYPKGRPIGEVLRNLPNELSGRAAKDLPDAWTPPDGEYVIAHCKKTTVMLVSRSCDIDKESRKHFLVAPVLSVGSLPDAQKTEGKLRDLRTNEIMHWFYLPEKQGLPESFADLTKMVPIHRSFFDEETPARLVTARLSGLGTTAFQKCLSDFYGTKFGFVGKDICPQTGRYACSACFYSGQGSPRSTNFDEGKAFGDCDICKELTLWVKLP
jgi:hypothetical protein